MKDIVLEENVMVKMSDGIRLAVDLYKPEIKGKFPALFAMSPYGKEFQRYPGGIYPFVEAGNINYFVSRGYVYVIADSRGSFPSEGRWDFFDDREQQDGAELIEWAARQSWCDGNVAMIGESYYALIQYLVASLQPPSLKTIVPFDGMTDLYRDCSYHGGIWTQGFMAYWTVNTCRRCLPPEGIKVSKKWSLPEDIPTRNIFYATDGPFYQERSAATKFGKIKIPVYHGVCPSRLVHYRGQLNAYAEINTPKKLVVAPGPPWASFYNEETCRHITRWLDYWLKGIDTKIMDEPPVVLYLAGSDEWRNEDEYPLARTKWTKFYLQSNGKAGEPPYGLLSEKVPGKDDQDSYLYPESQKKVEANLPVLGYLSPPLKEDTDIIGPASLTFYAASNGTDTAWFVKIDDEAPDGTIKMISKGWLKASHRQVDETKSKTGQPFHTHTRPAPIEPDKIYKYEIEIWPIFRTFKAGHKIRLRIASNDSHIWDVDIFHAGVDNLVKNTIYHDRDFPSYLLLPVILGKSSGSKKRPPIKFKPRSADHLFGHIP